MKRREFLWGVAAATLYGLNRREWEAAAAEIAASAKDERGFLLSAYSPPESPSDRISLYDLSSAKLHMIDCPKMDAHGMAQNPKKPSSVAVFGQRTAWAAVIDTQKKRTVARIEASPGRKFYGHGAFSPDAKLIYATEFDLKENQGAIVIRDAVTYKVLGDFPSHGVLPHEVYLTPDGKTLVVANQGDSSVKPAEGRGPSVCYIEVPTGKLMHKITCGLDSVNFGHLAVNKKMQVAIGADRKHFLKEENGRKLYDYFPTPILFGGLGEKSGEYFPPEPAKAKCLNSLSLAINESTGDVGATYTEGGVVNFWNMETRGLSHTWDMKGKRPLGVAVLPGGAQFAVNSTDSDLFFVNARTFAVEKEISYKGKGAGVYFCGPHLIHLA